MRRPSATRVTSTGLAGASLALAGLLLGLPGCSEPFPEHLEYACPCPSGWECYKDICRKSCTNGESCPDGTECNQGLCKQQPGSGPNPDCIPSCYTDEGGIAECGDDGCGGQCGWCLSGQVCSGGHCKDGSGCESQCYTLEGLKKQCGPDGCGGFCGQCPVGQTCSSGFCSGGGGSSNPIVNACNGLDTPSGNDCQGTSFQGCCGSDNRLYWCDNGSLYCIDCSQSESACGWAVDNGFYDCNQQGKSEPTGNYPRECSATP